VAEGHWTLQKRKAHPLAVDGPTQYNPCYLGDPTILVSASGLGEAVVWDSDARPGTGVENTVA